LNNSVD